MCKNKKKLKKLSSNNLKKKVNLNKDIYTFMYMHMSIYI